MQSCLGAGDDRVLARADIRAVTWEQLKSGRHARQARDEIALVGRELVLMDFDELETLAARDGWLVGWLAGSFRSPNRLMRPGITAGDNTQAGSCVAACPADAETGRKVARFSPRNGRSHFTRRAIS